MLNKTLMALAVWTALAAAAAAEPQTPSSAEPAFAAVARGARIFYETNQPGPDAQLMVRDDSGTRRIASGAIQSFAVSPDGARLAVALQSDATSLAVYDAATGALLAGPLTGIDGDIAGWSEDSHTLYFVRRNGGAVRLEAWRTPSAPSTLQTYDGRIVSVAMRNHETFLLVRDGAASRLLALRTGKPQTAAIAVIAARPGEALDSVHAASDAVYVVARDGAHASLLRVPAATGDAIAPTVPSAFAARCRNCRSFPGQRRSRIAEIAVPDGVIASVLSDPRTPGIWVVLATSPAGTKVLRYDPSIGHFIRERTLPSM